MWPPLGPLLCDGTESSALGLSRLVLIFLLSSSYTQCDGDYRRSFYTVKCYGKINKVPHFLSQGLLRKTCIIVPVLPTPRCYCGDQAHKALGSPGLHPVFRLQGTLGPQGAFCTWSLVVWLLLLAELEFVAGVGICRTVTVAAAALLFPHPPFVFSNSHLPISIFSFSLIVGE